MLTLILYGESMWRPNFYIEVINYYMLSALEGHMLYHTFMKIQTQNLYLLRNLSWIMVLIEQIGQMHTQSKKYAMSTNLGTDFKSL